MLEPEAFLQSSGKRLKSEVIIRLKAPFNCFRTSRSELWLLKWNSRLLFVIMTPVLSQWPALSFIKSNNLFKKMEGCINTIYEQCYSVGRFAIRIMAVADPQATRK